MPAHERKEICYLGNSNLTLRNKIPDKSNTQTYFEAIKLFHAAECNKETYLMMVCRLILITTPGHSCIRHNVDFYFITGLDER